MTIDEAFTKNLDSIMELNSITATKLAERSGLSPAHIRTIRNGECQIKLRTAYAICRGLRKTLGEMTKGADE